MKTKLLLGHSITISLLVNKHIFSHNEIMIDINEPLKNLLIITIINGYWNGKWKTRNHFSIKKKFGSITNSSVFVISQWEQIKF